MELKEIYEKADRKMLDINYAAKQPQTPIPEIRNRESNIQKEIDFPIMLTSVPNYMMLEGYVPNNKWMEDASKEQIEDDIVGAVSQYFELTTLINQMALTYTIPGVKGLSDLVFVANMGLVLPEHVAPNTIIFSNFRSQPRIGEIEVGRKFFDLMNWNYVQSPYFFEGFADCKPLKQEGNETIFLGGYGVRTDIKSYEWMMDNFNMKIVPIKMDNPYLYHFDCLVFPIDSENVIVSELLGKENIKLIEKYANVHVVSKDDSMGGTLNSVRLGPIIINHSCIDEIPVEDEYYPIEQKRINNLNNIAAKCGYDIVYTNISCMESFGAMLSCCVLPLNYPFLRF